MKKLFLLLFLLQFPIAAFAAGTPPSECSRCGGIADPSAPVSVTVPLLVQGRLASLGEVTNILAPLSPEQRHKATVGITMESRAGDNALTEVESDIKTLADWAAANGPFAAFGVTMPEADVTVEAYAVKRLAVTLQGLNLADRIVYGPASMDRLTKLYDTGAQSYFDQILVPGDSLDSALAWISEKDPSKILVATVPAAHPNVFYDLARAFEAGATVAFLTGSEDQQIATSVARFNEAMIGDFASDKTSDIKLLNRQGEPRDGTPLALVRGEDLRTLIVPPGDASQWSIVSVAGTELISPRRVDANGIKPITDTGKKNGRTLVGLPPVTTPFLVMMDRPKLDESKVARESIDVNRERGITVEEIIRNHQAHRAFQDSIQQRWTARDETNLRFAIGQGAESVEATIAGPYFFDPAGTNDWVWQDFYINGVRWKYGKIPELPIIQAEKVTQLPLDLHFTNEYHYSLVGQSTVRGFDTWEVRFEPPPNAPLDLPLYRGTVWIDRKNWARVRMSMVQLNLHGEILSNEERIDYVPVTREGGKPLAATDSRSLDPKSLLWIPFEINAQQVVSAAGRATPVLRQTVFTNFRLNPENFDELHREASASTARMVRETDHGMKYLERTADGQRVVQENPHTSRTFLAGGLHHDAGLDFPVLPLGGFDYFNYNFRGTGLQTNVFFAGVILTGNVSKPALFKSRTDAGADLFAIAIPFGNVSYRGGHEIESEAVKSLPLSIAGRVGHPFLGFGKIDFSLGLAHISYQRSETTAADFVVPSDTFEITPTVTVRYDRRGYTAVGFFSHGSRTKWEPWGDPSEFDAAQKNFDRYGLSFGKTFYLPKFQRIAAEVDYLDGQNLDRFSKFELGFFGSQRVRGVKSGSVRAEQAVLGHLSYGFVFSEQFRLEAFYDHALVNDTASGFHREPYQGVGIGGQTIGPWGTLLRLDLGKTIGRNAQDDFVANVVLLKLFG